MKKLLILAAFVGFTGSARAQDGAVANQVSEEAAALQALIAEYEAKKSGSPIPTVKASTPSNAPVAEPSSIIQSPTALIPEKPAVEASTPKPALPAPPAANLPVSQPRTSGLIFSDSPVTAIQDEVETNAPAPMAASDFPQIGGQMAVAPPAPAPAPEVIKEETPAPAPVVEKVEAPIEMVEEKLAPAAADRMKPVEEVETAVAEVKEEATDTVKKEAPVVKKVVGNSEKKKSSSTTSTKKKAVAYTKPKPKKPSTSSSSSSRKTVTSSSSSIPRRKPFAEASKAKEKPTATATSKGNRTLGSILFQKRGPIFKKRIRGGNGSN